jgi:multiple sugar transport system ATP-binding protein
MAVVELEHIEKVFPGGVRAVVDLSLRIDDGELLVCVGPSGCGKSTVLRMVAGLEEPTAGTLRIDGRVVNALAPQERNVAMVFQDYALYPHLTARGNLEFPLRMRGLRGDAMAREVERIAGLLELVPLLDRLPKELSGGQRQRVAMGRALVRAPTVFLLDEPLSNLDARLRVQVRAEIEEIQTRTRTTTLYVTHDQVEALTLGDRVAILDRGRLQQVAPPREIYERPANAFVASFIGNPPMNLLPARLEAGAGGGLVVRLGAHAVPIAPAGVGAEKLRTVLGAPLTAGVRPEALRVAPRAGGGIPAGVTHVEFLGHETLVHLVLDGTEALRLVARVPGSAALTKGDAVGVVLDPERIYLFDADGCALGP